MVKIIIVDDEKVTRESLKNYVPWDSLKIGQVRVARNGIEALAVAEEEPPDILLTDVRMPKMDGIELAEKIRAAYPQCRIVFLSGYADKEYLKRAIQLHAVDYIEKPVKLDAVISVMQAIAAECLLDRQKEQQLDIARTHVHETMELLRDEVCRSLVNGRPDLQKLAVYCRNEPPVFEPDTCFTASVLAINWRPGATDELRDRGRDEIIDVCSRVEPFSLPSAIVGFCDRGQDGDLVALVVPRRITQGNNGVERSLFRIARLLACIPDRCFDATIGVGNPVTGLAAVAASYESACRSLSLAFYRSGQSVFFPAESRHETLSIGADRFASFRMRLQERDRDGAEEIVRSMAEAARAQEPSSVDSVRNAFFRLYLVVFEVLWSRTATALPATGDQTYIWQEVSERRSLDDLESLISNYVGSSLGEVQDSAPVPLKVHEARRYVQERYSDPGLSLQSIADHVGLSRTYLSSLFRSATGGNLNDYVTTIRMERAKELLLTTVEKTHAVALKVGYITPGYFSSLFKKSVGVSPSEYRQRESRR